MKTKNRFQEKYYKRVGGIIGVIVCIILFPLILAVLNYSSTSLSSNAYMIYQIFFFVWLLMGYILPVFLGMLSAGFLGCNFKTSPCILESGIGMIIGLAMLSFVYFWIGYWIGGFFDKRRKNK